MDSWMGTWAHATKLGLMGRIYGGGGGGGRLRSSGCDHTPQDGDPSGGIGRVGSVCRLGGGYGESNPGKSSGECPGESGIDRSCSFPTAGARLGCPAAQPPLVMPRALESSGSATCAIPQRDVPSAESHINPTPSSIGAATRDSTLRIFISPAPSTAQTASPCHPGVSTKNNHCAKCRTGEHMNAHVPSTPRRAP